MTWANTWVKSLTGMMVVGLLGVACEQRAVPPPGSAKSEAPAPTRTEVEPSPAAEQTGTSTAPTIPTIRPTLTPTARMAFHNREAEVLRSAVVAGNPSAASPEAKNLSAEHWTPHLAPAWKAHMDAMYEAADGYTRAASVRGAALAVGNLGLACAGCHQALGGPKNPPSDPVPTAAMAAHAWAVEQLWFGLMAPSESAWLQGAQLLAKAPIVRSDVAEVDAEATRLQQLGARAEVAAGKQRAVAFGELLNTCANCHRRVGLERP